MARNAVRSPGSRLGDDLYRLYLAALAWLVFPVYGEIFAVILPTSATTMRWTFPIAAICAQLGWLWSGSRGGPMAVTRASIVHELAAPVPRRRVLAPQLLRQAVAWGAGAAMVGGILTSFGDSYAFSIAFPVSVACFLLAFGAVMWALVVMVGGRATASERLPYLASALIAAIGVSVVAILTEDITSMQALTVFGVAAVAGSAVAWHALDRVPVRTVWERARNLESARSAMLEVDFHRMMIDLRGAGDDKAEGETRLPSGWLPLWRCIAPIRHALPWSGIRLAASVIAAVLLLLFAPQDQGVVLLATGAVWLLLGYEITRGIASVAGQVSFLLHYPRNSAVLLAGQLAASVLLGGAAIALVYGWWFAVDTTEATVAVIVASMGVLGGGVQARLGSPNTTEMVQEYGLQNAAAALWLRAATAPIAVLVTIIVVFHGFALQPVDIGFDLGFDIDLAGPARWLIAVLFLVSIATCLRPLEKAAR